MTKEQIIENLNTLQTNCIIPEQFAALDEAINFLENMETYVCARTIEKERENLLKESNYFDGYKTLQKRKICDELGEFLDKHGLVEYDEYFNDRNDLVIRACIKVYNPNKKLCHIEWKELRKDGFED